MTHTQTGEVFYASRLLLNKGAVIDLVCLSEVVTDRYALLSLWWYLVTDEELVTFKVLKDPCPESELKRSLWGELD